MSMEEGSFTSNGEADQPSAVTASNSNNYKRGGWITSPFITVTLAGLTLAAGGWTSNLVVYMIKEFNTKSIDAAQIGNVVNGCIFMFPVLGAIVADSFLGSFTVIWISSLVSLMGITLLLLGSTINSLRISPCNQNGPTSCINPSKLQLSILYLAIALATIGAGGSRFALAAIGADQFDDRKHQRSFLNWYIFTLYTSSAISTTAIVYIEDNVSWGWGFGICAAANIVGLVVFVLGSPFYRLVKPKRSPFLGLVQVVVAVFRKRNLVVSNKSEDYYNYQRREDIGGRTEIAATPTSTLQFLNRAALNVEGDIKPDGSNANPWKLCTLQQVEDLKNLIKLLPLWSTGIFLFTPVAVLVSLSTPQALIMDRQIGNHFKIPASSMLIFMIFSTSLSVIFLDRFLYPMWQKSTGRYPSPLQQIGVGHVIWVISLAIAAIVEQNRLKKAHNITPNSVVPMSVFWLVPQLALVGFGEAFHFPGYIALYYQEFPAALKSTATAMTAMIIAIAFYMGTALVGMVQRGTKWLPNDINEGRLDNVYWVLFGLGVVNFGYYLMCASFYKYHALAQGVDENNI